VCYISVILVRNNNLGVRLLLKNDSKGVIDAYDSISKGVWDQLHGL